jgi:hypothetical protein
MSCPIYRAQFWLEYNLLFQQKDIKFSDFIIKHKEYFFNCNIVHTNIFLLLKSLIYCKENDEFKKSILIIKNNISQPNFYKGLINLQKSIIYENCNNDDILNFIEIMLED